MGVQTPIQPIFIYSFAPLSHFEVTVFFFYHGGR